MALYLQIPVQRTCIHKIPVHGANIHSMDGNAWYFNLGFPSIDLAYTESPSTVPLFTVWTGMQGILPSDSRPQTLYTQNPRPGKEHAVYPRHFTHTPFRTFALALSQPYTISYPHLILYLAAILYIFSDLLCIFPHRYNHLYTFCHLNNYRCHTSVPAQQPRPSPGSSRTQETAGAVIYRIWISVPARFCRNSIALPLFFYENGFIYFLSSSSPAPLPEPLPRRRT